MSCNTLYAVRIICVECVLYASWISDKSKMFIKFIMFHFRSNHFSWPTVILMQWLVLVQYLSSFTPLGKSALVVVTLFCLLLPFKRPSPIFKSNLKYSQLALYLNARTCTTFIMKWIAYNIVTLFCSYCHGYRCRHCQELAPVWDQLANKCADSSSGPRIAKVCN